MEEAYERRMMGEGPYYRERQKGRVQCRECGGEMVDVLVEGHMMKQHGRAAEERWSWTLSAKG